MTATLITGIGLLVTQDPAYGAIPAAAMVVEDDRVAWVGPQSAAPDADLQSDVDGRCVVPGFVDSHSHVVFAGDRAEEFAARMSGARYTTGGIATTIRTTRAAADDALLTTAARLSQEALASGTTTLEVKSGYGLTVADEVRSLKAAGSVTDEVTFLGAHVIPPEYQDRPDEYVALVTGPMLEACAPHAKWADVSCEASGFDADRTQAVLEAARSAGLGLRVHANQFHHDEGVALAVEFDAASADHCTYLTDRDLDALAGSRTVATLLPAAEFSTRSPYPDARRMLGAGVTVALATDCNPGSAYTTSMPFCIALAVREMGMTPEEALWSATQGGAQALRRDDIGRLSPGAYADAVVLDAPSPVYLAYRPGVATVHSVLRRGTRAFTR
ncbi:imidazolonepropionase [Amycolatopsis jejuensis]|uniref:imidazolonepropionase n=1 Tax=Amycolatopsis jejuensis TaxID=330084 RepID=UPI000527691B|nr:imidazolonepropionase [Amycolatopsis jejuensis]